MVFLLEWLMIFLYNIDVCIILYTLDTYYRKDVYIHREWGEGSVVL